MRDMASYEPISVMPTAGSAGAYPSLCSLCSLWSSSLSGIKGVSALALAATITGAAAVAADRPLVIVITGESNSGGIGLNSQATSAELQPRPSVQIMNLTNGLFSFEPLQLGVNNLRDHDRLEGYYSTCHGFENELANAVETNAFPGFKQVYLIKTGQGGSTIQQWAGEAPGGYWSQFMQRIEAGKRQLPANPRWVVWFSLGINDAIAGTPVAQWKKDVIAHLKRIKTQLPGATILMTQFQSMGYPQINEALAAIADEEANVFVIDSSKAELRDTNHWS